MGELLIVTIYSIYHDQSKLICENVINVYSQGGALVVEYEDRRKEFYSMHNVSYAESIPAELAETA